MATFYTDKMNIIIYLMFAISEYYFKKYPNTCQITNVDLNLNPRDFLYLSTCIVCMYELLFTIKIYFNTDTIKEYIKAIISILTVYLIVVGGIIIFISNIPCIIQYSVVAIMSLMVWFLHVYNLYLIIQKN
jgi:hypothetical protein